MTRAVGVESSHLRVVPSTDEISLSMLIKFGAVIIFSPIFTLPGIAAFLIGGWAGQMYIKAQLSVKREMSNARSPVLSHFGAAIAGIGALPPQAMVGICILMIPQFLSAHILPKTCLNGSHSIALTNSRDPRGPSTT